MDAHPSTYVDQISILTLSAPVVSRRTSPAAGPGSRQEGIPASIPIPRVPPPPSFIAHREGRFFIVQSLKASLPGSPSRWRCILATASQGYVTHRDFGPHDSDYVLAVHFGREFEEQGIVSEEVAP